MADEEQRIGPYRLLERLGAGGMGEVWLAEDERLGRRVAVKRIHPELGRRSGGRERFRREARLAASLNHPAIVQVYDLLSDGDQDDLVLEYVEGKTLRQFLDRGPLGVHRTLEIARALARGLEHAHQQGVIHRDLKSENILVTPSGQPKIVDFGIARRFTEDASITRPGILLGTYRSLSPEQARGERLDARSDLFSFGVLLYEALTGESPFLAENPVATLHRILHHQPAPVGELNPAVPPELSRLVDHLLQKKARLRPRSAGEVARALDGFARDLLPDSEATFLPGESLPESPVESRDSALTAVRPRPRLVLAGALLLLAGLVLSAPFLLRGRRAPLYVAVLSPVIETQGAAPDGLLALGVRSSVARALTALEGVSCKSFGEVDAVSGPPATVARAVAADEAVESQIRCGSSLCRVTLNRLRGEDATVLSSRTFAVPSDDFSLVSSAVDHEVQAAYAEMQPRAGSSASISGSVGSGNLRAFLEIRQSLDAGLEAPEVLLERLAALRSRAPRFVEAYLLEADVARRRFFHSREAKDLEHALALAGEAQDLAPGDPQPLLTLFAIDLEGGRFAEAESVLAGLEELLPPGDVRLLERRAQLLQAQGQPEEAIALLETVVQRNPSWMHLVTLAQLEYRNGRISRARQRLGLALQRSPGNRRALSLLARIELFNGDLERALSLHEELVRVAPGPAELANLSLAQMLSGRYEDSVEAARRLLEMQPDNAGFNLNLADSYAFLGRTEEARRLYRKVVELAAADPGGLTPDLLTAQAQALAHLGQGRQAASAVQEALRLAPADGGIAYQASVVYAVLGERSSALATAESALEQGLEPRWFDLPWFADLRGSPDFQALLRAHSAAGNRAL